MPYAKHKSEYDREGFTIVRQFLTPSELGMLRQELDGFIQNVVPTLASNVALYETPGQPDTLKQLQAMAANSDFFRAYCDNPKWKELAEAMLEEPAHCDDPEWFNKPPKTTHPTPPHQDNYYFKLVPPNVLTIWCALDDVDAENGCLRYVKGSHLQPPRPHHLSKVVGFSQGISDFGEADLTNEVEIHLQPGDVTVHHGWTIHRAEPNRSTTRHRRSFAMVFKGISCRRDEAAHQRYLQSLQQQRAEAGMVS
ncbi:phytanoyl-CoA dioxygenase family protein [Planctomicrobium sp. SH664]|uniref:phytanoyl-CoA dioxygenase family protein n=1 Tax=Planctomicrobium sp. SH664 TaxID=3448125 RepID=UPI003F5B8DB4